MSIQQWINDLFGDYVQPSKESMERSSVSAASRIAPDYDITSTQGAPLPPIQVEELEAPPHIPPGREAAFNPLTMTPRDKEIQELTDNYNTEDQEPTLMNNLREVVKPESIMASLGMGHDWILYINAMGSAPWDDTKKRLPRSFEDRILITEKQTRPRDLAFLKELGMRTLKATEPQKDGRYAMTRQMWQKWYSNDPDKSFAKKSLWATHMRGHGAGHFYINPEGNLIFEDEFDAGTLRGPSEKTREYYRKSENEKEFMLKVINMLGKVAAGTMSPIEPIRFHFWVMGPQEGKGLAPTSRINLGKP